MIGFPGWTGGVLQYINGYEGGLAGFVARTRELRAAYGERLAPPALLLEMAQRGSATRTSSAPIVDRPVPPHRPVNDGRGGARAAR